MKVFFDTVGCRLNQAEIEQMAAQFRAAGHTILENSENADLVVVNSCAVTAAAASDSRQKVRQAKKAGAHEIIYTGCLATLQPEDSLLIEGVSRVIPNQYKMTIPGIMLQGTELIDLEPLARKPLLGARKRTRAFIKAQDGCDNFCTFCITRIARGRSTSIPKHQIFHEVLAAQAGGTHEVVLTGVNLGSWGSDDGGGETITDLVKYLLDQSQIERLRFSSTEPWDLDDRFFELWQNPRMCRHLHLPLQSGSAAVLRRMARNTTPTKYHVLLKEAREAIPGLAVTTDIIVGFPGETDAEFQESLDFVKEMRFSGGHVFKYSAREGTAAAKFPSRVNGKVAADRSQKMRSVLAESAAQFESRFIDTNLVVLWETARKIGPQKWKLHGWSDNYLPVNAAADEDRSNRIDRVWIENAEPGTLNGKII